jgi:transposase
MLSQAQRTTILELSAQGVSRREIARMLGISRPTVRKVVRSNSTEVPEIVRAEKAEPYRQRILELFSACKENLVRVHEELTAGGAALSYPALTAFCRKQGIGQSPVVAAGQYHFEPGEEMQHDTSPHEVQLAGKKRKVQTASGVLCYSRMLFFQCYPTFQRFDCKVFLTDAVRYFGGASERVMIDNTHVVVLRGTGREMVPVPEMAAFGERFGFRFVAHAIGNANRSARVERPFWFIENNFLAGRTFTSWEDLNRQAREWCDKVNSTYKKHIRAVPRELFAVERLRLRPLPAWIPEVYRLHQRMVDIEGYVALHTNRYWLSTPGSPTPRIGGSCWRSTGRRGARASNVPTPIPKRKPSWRLRPRWPTMSRPSSNEATRRLRLPCANCCAWCASIHGNRCWPPCGKPPATVSTTWTGWNG